MIQAPKLNPAEVTPKGHRSMQVLEAALEKQVDKVGLAAEVWTPKPAQFLLRGLRGLGLPVGSGF